MKTQQQVEQATKNLLKRVEKGKLTSGQLSSSASMYMALQWVLDDSTLAATVDLILQGGYLDKEEPVGNLKSLDSSELGERFLKVKE